MVNKIKNLTGINAKSFLVLLGAFFIFLLTPSTAKAAWSNNNIISDGEFSAQMMTEQQIQEFLVSKGSYLANYYETRSNLIGVPEREQAQGKRASYIIWFVANEYKLNPQVLLATLQKEQSLITVSSLNQYGLDWAMGYGVPDSGNRDYSKIGFSKQVDWGGWQLKYNMVNASGVSDSPKFTNPSCSKVTPYCKGSLNLYIDGVQVIPASGATASLYRYTPHFHGNQNFYNIYNTWFQFGRYIHENIRLSDHLRFNWDFPLGGREDVNYAVKNYTDNQVTLQWLLVTGRDKNGAIVDFPIRSNVILEAGEQKSFVDSRYLNELGVHTVWVVYCYEGSWNAMTPDGAGIRNLGYISVRKPNITVEGIGFDPASPVVESPTTLNFALRNNELISINLDVLDIPNVPTDKRWINYSFGNYNNINLSAGERREFAPQQIIGEQGLYDFSINIRTGNIWFEICWANGVSSRTYYWAKLPAINIAGVRFSNTFVNSDITVTFDVRNNEGMPLSYPSLAIINRAVDQPYVNLDFGSQANVVVPATGTASVELSKKLYREGLYVASLADCSTGVCKEITWANGDSSKTYYWVRKPNINISGVRFLNTVFGQDTVVAFDVRNNENIPLTYSAMAIINRYAISPYVNLDFGATTLTIAPGEVATIQLSKRLYTPGLYVASLADCSTGYCEEIRWSNNDSSKTYYLVK